MPFEDYPLNVQKIISERKKEAAAANNGGKMLAVKNDSGPKIQNVKDVVKTFYFIRSPPIPSVELKCLNTTSDTTLSSPCGGGEDSFMSCSDGLGVASPMFADQSPSPISIIQANSAEVSFETTWLSGRLVTPSNYDSSSYETASSSSSNSSSIQPFKTTTNREIVFLDDDLESPVLLYQANQVISLRKATHAFLPHTVIVREKTLVPKELPLLGIFKHPSSSFEDFSSKYWSKRSNFIAGNEKSYAFVKEVFKSNIDVEKLLGQDFEQRFLQPNRDGSCVIYGDDCKGSVRRHLSAMDFRGLLNGELCSSQIQEICGLVFMEFRKELYNKNDMFALPPDSFFKSNLSFDILPVSTLMDQIKAIQVSKMNCGNIPGVEDVIIPYDTRHLVCSFMRPDWTGVGTGHAAFLSADLIEHSIVSYDPLRLDMDECVTAFQTYILQYSMRGSPSLQYAVSKDTKWTVYDLNKVSLKQNNGVDCVMWSTYVMFCRFVDIPANVYLIPKCDLRYCIGEAWGWSGCGLVNEDVNTMKNNEAHGDQEPFIDRWRLFLAYILSHVTVGPDNVSLVVPSLAQIVTDFKNAAMSAKVRKLYSFLVLSCLCKH
jgi:hypothetical protein